MSTGYGDRHTVVFHHLAEQLCAGEHGDSLFLYIFKLRIVGMNGSSVNHQVNVICDIGRHLRAVNCGTKGFEMIGEPAYLCIGS